MEIVSNKANIQNVWEKINLKLLQTNIYYLIHLQISMMKIKCSLNLSANRLQYLKKNRRNIYL
jgi:hypothetical protein